MFYNDLNASFGSSLEAINAGYALDIKPTIRAVTIAPTASSMLKGTLPE